MELISVRIPRTGSSTLSNILDITYSGQKIVPPLIGEAWREDSILYTNRVRSQEVIREYAKLLHEHKFIHLHLPVWAWKGLFPGVPRVCIMREPLTWVISCYFFAKSLRHIPNHMGIWEYMEIPYRQNWQSWYMDSSINNFDFIGFQETYDEDVTELFNYLGKERPCDQPSLNVSVDPVFLSVKADLLKDKMFLRRVKKIFKKDYRLYEAAWSKWKGNTPPMTILSSSRRSVR
jgi:hypothetical protein